MDIKALRAISSTNILLKRWILFFKKPSLYQLTPSHSVSPTGYQNFFLKSIFYGYESPTGYLKHQHLAEKMDIIL